MAVLAGVSTVVFVSGGTVFAMRHALYLGVALTALIWGVWGGVIAGTAAGILSGLLDWPFPIPPSSEELGTWLARLVLFLALGGGFGVVRHQLSTMAARAAGRSLYERAVAACSRVLLVGRVDAALDIALAQLLEATEATEIYVDINYHDPELGLCARTEHEIARDGFEALIGLKTWTNFAYRENPTAYQFLSRGEAFQLTTSRVTGSERAFYEGAGVRSELALPIMVGSEWLGVVGFADHVRERVWRQDEVRLLTTVAEMIGAFWDRGRADEALRESESRFRQLVEASPEPIAVHADGVIVYANAAAATLVGGSSAEELMGMSVLEFVHPDSSEAVVSRMRGLTEAGRPVEPLEERFVRLDGSVIDVEVAALPITYEGRSAAQVVIRDITPQKVAHRQLEELVQQKDEFLASISHELRTPLTAVLGLARQMSDQHDTISAEESKELIGIIADQATEMAHIIEDLLVEARGDLGTLGIRSELVDLGRETDLAMTSFADVKLVQDAEVLTLADPIRVRQIVRNMLTNAIRYGGANVTVVVAADPPVARVAVYDDGVGIPEGHWEGIFEPYHRAHDPGTQPASVGLGLTVSRRLARLMGGDLTYQWKDGESVFELTLPLQSG
ncbi:MAG: PAS domain S-box protein [Acidimicrobiia bacterium]|nr:PAS domain S-box protein [Acidimicrobiia bacterium]